MPRIITTAQAFAYWEAEYKPVTVQQYGEDDTVTLSESWNDYSDSLCKDGELTALQYNYAPAYDDDMPGDSWDEELSHLLDSMGVVVTVEKITTRPDGHMTDMPRGSTHWEATITRGGDHVFKTYYSQGPAHTHTPDASDIIGALLKDIIDDTSGEYESDFRDWAENLGYDTDSRAAEKIYTACLEISDYLRKIFNAQDLDDLRDIANEL